MARFRDIRDVRRLAARALANGGRQTGAATVEWNLAGNCERPYGTVHRGRPEVDRPYHMHDKGVQYVEILTRCRNCEPCRKVRRNLWSYRASAETQAWPRTWFGTLTLRPEAHWRFLTEARAKGDAGGTDIDTEVSPEEAFRRYEARVWREVDLMLKRIRQARVDAGEGNIRYLCVTERHKSGVAHYHLLVHQVGEMPLKHTALEGGWPHGFTKWRLVKHMAEARYVAKYLAKDAVARVRASQSYGEAFESFALEGLSLLGKQVIT